MCTTEKVWFIAYHAILKSVAKSESWTCHANSVGNQVDLYMKEITQDKQKYIVNEVLHDVYDVEVWTWKAIL